MSLTARHIYMVGIGGIGMSALAQLLVREGKEVSGSDRDESPTTLLLRGRGVEIEIGEGTLPDDADLLIYSDAIPTGNAARAQARERGIEECSYFEALGEISKHMRTLAVAGTHGKTTTTGMLAKILADAGESPTAVIGSIVRDFESNFLPGRSDLLVVEACEYRDHLLKFAPDILVITNIELDHTDYFPDLRALQETFRKAIARVRPDGVVITNPSDPIIAEVIAGATVPVLDYTKEAVPEIGLIGEFNRMNARAAAAAARAAFPTIKQGTIDRALVDFKGSWRRFEYRGETPTGALVYDDYAHHPTAIEKTIEGARERFPGKKIVVAFHPHLYSRTKSLLQEFALALGRADEAFVAPIYAAREVDTGEVSSEMVAAAAREAGGRVQALGSFDAIRDALLRYGVDTLIITMGAGDIYKVAEEITE